MSRGRPPKKSGAHTNYSLAWEQFTRSREYQRVVTILSQKGMRQPYIDNLLRAPFEAAWHLTGTQIKIVTDGTHH